MAEQNPKVKEEPKKKIEVAPAPEAPSEEEKKKKKTSKDNTKTTPKKQYTLKDAGKSLKSIMKTVNNNAKKVKDTYKKPKYTKVTDAQVRDVNNLQKQLGVNFTYDRNEIENIYNDATKAALQMEQSSGAERQYYNHLAAQQNTALDTVRQQYGQALASGANRGMQAANMLSTILGTTQTANDEATQLAQDRQTLVNKYAQQMRQNSVDALQYSNEIANTIGGLSHQLYNDDIQAKTAELSYNQGINTDYAGYNASKYTADANLSGTLAGLGAGVYNNNQSAIAALQSAIEQAKATREAAETTGKYNKKVAQINKED